MKKLLFISLTTVLLGSCSVSSKKAPKGGINVFSIQQDKELGLQVSGEIAADPVKYPVLDSATNVEAYRYLYNIRNTILNTGKVKYKDEFAWQIKIIRDDSTLNAFATPGGYIYVYTGLIKFLDNEAELAGVIGHEIAHADLRHSTHQMTTQYGVQTLIKVIAGNRKLIQQVTTSIVGLKFSRHHETESDRMSVEYLCGTKYKADGGAGFFEKIEAMGGKRQPEFLSTHPSPENRIENYHKWATDNNCGGTNDYATNYAQFKKLF